MTNLYRNSNILSKVFYSFAVVTMVAMSISPGVFASSTPGDGGGDITTPSLVCDPAKFSQQKVQDSFPVSIIGTALMFVLGAEQAELPSFMTFGASSTEKMGCLYYLKDLLPEGGNNMKDIIDAYKCQQTDSAICASLVNEFKVGGERSTAAGFNTKEFARSKVSGSLLGYTYMVSNAIQYEPVPVNTAYFFKDYAAKLPIIGDKVYAQEQAEYGQFLVNQSVVIWKLFRNLAYTAMSLVMLWTGFAIITRKRISAQTVVSVQYALPKIVIALVVIAFSFPIGASITSLSWTLWNSSGDIVKSLSSQLASVDSLRKMGIGGFLIMMESIMVATGGAGSMPLVVSIVAIICLLFFLFAYLKAFWIYIKMIVMTCAAPLQIALYSLPGNDDKLELWLKNMIAMGLGIFGMRFVMDIVGAFSLNLIVNAYVANDNGLISPGQALTSGALFNVFLIPIIMVFGYATAIKVPSMLQEMLVGKPKR